MPRLVVLDGHALNPGDLDWSPLAACGELKVHDRTPPDLVMARAAGAAVVLTNKTPLPRAVIDALPDLRAIAVLATGWNVVDGAAARARGIPVMNVPDYGTAAVAQHAIALLLELTQAVGLHSGAVHAGDWARSPDWCFWRTAPVELSGLTMGIVGLGAIGRRTAAIAQALGMQVVALARPGGSSSGASDGIPRLARAEFLAAADVISLHCPLTPQTAHLVDAAWLAAMKPTAYLVNTARGPLIDEAALADALHRGVIAGAALDVLSAEPPPPDHPLTGAPRCVITPHLAWAARAARQRLLLTTVGNVRAFLAGNPTNVVNP